MSTLLRFILLALLSQTQLYCDFTPSAPPPRDCDVNPASCHCFRYVSTLVLYEVGVGLIFYRILTFVHVSKLRVTWRVGEFPLFLL